MATLIQPIARTDRGRIGSIPRAPLRATPPVARAARAVIQGKGSTPSQIARDEPIYPAQQESLLTSRPKVWAASLMPSAIVRYGAMVSVRSATVRWNLTASVAA